VGAAGRGAGGPKRQPVGRRASASFACRQAQGVAEGGVARGNRGGSGGPAQRGANPRPGGPPDGPGRLTASWAGKLPPFQPQGTLQLGAARSYVRGKYRLGAKQTRLTQLCCSGALGRAHASGYLHAGETLGTGGVSLGLSARTCSASSNTFP